MRKQFFCTVLMLGVFIPGMSSWAQTTSGCGFDSQVRALSSLLSESDYSSAIAKRAGYLEEMDRVEQVTQFQICTDQDGNASMKFNSPEEVLQGRIKSMAALVNGIATIEGVAAEGLQEAILGELNHYEAAISQSKSFAVTQKGTFEALWPLYRELKQSRETALANLNSLADRTLCIGLSREHLALAEIYHEKLDASPECNALERVYIKDMLRRLQPPGFSPLLDKETFTKLKNSCHNVASIQAEATVPEMPPEPPHAACWDESVPVDLVAWYWRAGYASTPFPVKGGFVCRARNWYDVIADGEVERYECSGENNSVCVKNPKYSYKIKGETNDEGHKVLVYQNVPYRAHITLYPPD